MAGTAGDGEPAEDIRASDAERDATVERLSAATGGGRVTLAVRPPGPQSTAGLTDGSTYSQ